MCLCVSQRRGGCKNSLVMSFVHIIHRHITAIWRRWFGVRLAWFRTWTKWPAIQLSMTNGQIFEYSFKYFSYSASPSPHFCLFFIFEKLDHFSRLFNREANFRKWIQFIGQQRPQTHILLSVVNHGKRKFEVLDNLHEPSVKKDVIKLNLNKLCIISELLRETTKNNFDKAL